MAEAVPDFDAMGDRALLIQVATTQHHMQHDISEIEKHNKETNGTVAKLVVGAAKQEGALLMLRWIMLFGVAVAGVAVGLIARGGV